MTPVQPLPQQPSLLPDSSFTPTSVTPVRPLPRQPSLPPDGSFTCTSTTLVQLPPRQPSLLPGASLTSNSTTPVQPPPQQPCSLPGSLGCSGESPVGVTPMTPVQPSPRQPSLPLGDSHTFGPSTPKQLKHAGDPAPDKCRHEEVDYSRTLRRELYEKDEMVGKLKAWLQQHSQVSKHSYWMVR